MNDSNPAGAEPAPETGPPRRTTQVLTAEQHADVQKKLDQVTDALNGLRFALEEVQSILTPCYGEKNGEACYLPDHHRGRHMSASGLEWYDED